MIRNILRRWIIGPEIKELRRLRIQMTEEISKERNDFLEHSRHIFEQTDRLNGVCDNTIKNNKDVIEENTRLIEFNEKILEENKDLTFRIVQNESIIKELTDIINILISTKGIDPREVIELTIIKLKPDIDNDMLIKTREDIMYEYSLRHNTKYVEDKESRTR